MSNFIPYFTGHVITYPCWDGGWSILVKRSQDRKCTKKTHVTPSHGQSRLRLFRVFSRNITATYQISIQEEPYVKINTGPFNLRSGGVLSSTILVSSPLLGPLQWRGKSARITWVSVIINHVAKSTTRIHPGLILGLRPANERRRYFVTTSLIGWAQT